MNEIWKPVVGYEGLYEVSSTGTIRGLKRNRIVAQHLHRTGYMYIVLTRDGIHKTLSVHRIVAKAFIQNPEGKREVNHKDFNKVNNNVTNLEWATTKENSDWNLNSERLAKKREATLKIMTEKTKVKVIQFGLDGSLIKTWDCIRNAEKTLGINGSNISACCNGKVKTAGGFKWQRVLSS